MKALILILLVALASGCICCPCSLEGSDDYIEPTETTTPYEPPTYYPETTTTYAPTTSTETSTTTTSQTTQTTLPITTTTYKLDLSQVSIQLAGCDDDYYGNAMIAGFIINFGETTIPRLSIRTELQDDDGIGIADGVKTLEINSLKPNEQRKFSVVYQSPGNWQKCNAKVVS
jgi:hypothetical protein